MCGISPQKGMRLAGWAALARGSQCAATACAGAKDPAVPTLRTGLLPTIHAELKGMGRTRPARRLLPRTRAGRCHPSDRPLPRAGGAWGALRRGAGPLLCRSIPGFRILHRDYGLEHETVINQTLMQVLPLCDPGSTRPHFR